MGSKRYNPLAGARPVFQSASIETTNRKVRVTGKQVKALGNKPLRTLNYESRPGKNATTVNMVYQADCDCFPAGIPSQDTLERQADAYIYGGAQAAEKNARRFHDNPANRCRGCNVLLPRTRVCDYCQ